MLQDFIQFLFSLDLRVKDAVPLDVQQEALLALLDQVPVLARLVDVVEAEEFPEYVNFLLDFAELGK